MWFFHAKQTTSSDREIPDGPEDVEFRLKVIEACKRLENTEAAEGAKSTEFSGDPAGSIIDVVLDY